MIKLPALEYHLAHTCNLACEQCSHYSNFRLSGSMPTPEQTHDDYAAWSDRLHPKRFALLGGEPTLNPKLTEHIHQARQSWPNSNLMLVTNGFHLHRHPDLPHTLVKTNCRLEVSQHGTADAYMKAFTKIKRLLRQWHTAHPDLQIKIRPSHRNWMRQYQLQNGKPHPFHSNPIAAHRICMQKTCIQLHQRRLFHCPTLAYFSMLWDAVGLTDTPTA